MSASLGDHHHIFLALKELELLFDPLLLELALFEFLLQLDVQMLLYLELGFEILINHLSDVTVVRGPQV